MGQEIVYCFKCQTRLVGSDFEKGRAFRAGARVACQICAREILSPEEIERARDAARPLRHVPEAAARPGSSSRLRPALARAARPDGRRTSAALWVGAGGALALLAVAAALSTSRGPARAAPPPSAPSPAPSPPAPPRDEPRPLRPVGFSGELAELDGQVEAFRARGEFAFARDLLEAARGRHPDPAWEKALEERLTRLRDELERREKAPAGQVRAPRPAPEAVRPPESAEPLREKKPSPPADAGRPAAPVPEGALLVYGDALQSGWRDFSWETTVDFTSSTTVFEGQYSISAAPRKLGGGLYLGRPEGLEISRFTHLSFRLYSRMPGAPIVLTLYQQKPTGRTIELHKRPEGLPAGRWVDCTFALKDLLASPEPVTGIVLQAYQVSTEPLFFVDHVLFLREPGSESAPAPSSALESYRARRSEAAARAAGRDYSGAEKILRDAMAVLPEGDRGEPQADLAALRAASEFLAEALQRAARLSRGEKIAVEFKGSGGRRRRCEGTVVQADAVRLSLQTSDGRLDIPLSEATSDWLAGLLPQHPGAALFRRLEGDGEPAGNARAEAPAWPPAVPPEEERAAIELFWTAERLFPRTRRRAEAIQAYEKVLSEHGGTAAALRLKPFIARRLEEAREMFWTADELTASEGFLATRRRAEGDYIWLSERPGREGAYLEIVFPALADGAPRAWIHAGGCCLETLAFSIQATELTASRPGQPSQKISLEPGAPDALEVRLPSLSLRRYHASHGGGPREPTRWVWIPLPLPRFASPGAKRVRILPDQPGFAAAAALVSWSRSAPPREAEVEAWIRTRPPFLPFEPTGRLLRETWSGIAGERLEDLTSHASFILNHASSVDWLSGAFSEANRGDNYGTRLRGYLHAPATGAYVFWILSDDASELWLSPEDQPAGKRRIAVNPSAVGRGDWERTPSQKSPPILLKAGQRYYVEALYKQGGGDGFLSVGWQLPDGTLERPIPPSRLSEYGGMPLRREEPLLFRAFNLGGPAIAIDGHPWESGNSPMLETSRERFENQTVPLRPPTDDARARMIRSSVFDPSGTRVRVSSLPSGSYDVFLYVWEDNDPQVIDLYVQGQPVLKGYSTGPAGTWTRLGPWRADVRDGTIEISCKGGHGNFSGLEIWQVAP